MKKYYGMENSDDLKLAGERCERNSRLALIVNAFSETRGLTPGYIIELSWRPNDFNQYGFQRTGPIARTDTGEQFVSGYYNNIVIIPLLRQPVPVGYCLYGNGDVTHFLMTQRLGGGSIVRRPPARFGTPRRAADRPAENRKSTFPTSLNPVHGREVFIYRNTRKRTYRKRNAAGHTRTDARILL